MSVCELVISREKEMMMIMSKYQNNLISPFFSLLFSFVVVLPLFQHRLAPDGDDDDDDNDDDDTEHHSRL